MKIRIYKKRNPAEKPKDESKLGFGKIFTDHLYSMYFNPEKGWFKPQILPFKPARISPSASVLHYGQALFEGTKCYRRKDGGLQLFRPADNIARMNKGAERLCMPHIDEEMALEGMKQLVKLDADWVPHSPDTSLYIRPYLIATDPQLGVHASKCYNFSIILSPVGSYYPEGIKPVSIYVEDEYVRAVRGGVGNTKCAGNYAASILAGELAAKKGFTQVLWLDGVHRKYVEEVGSMNIMFAYGKKIITPELNGSILPGITRDSILKLARQMGYETSEERISIDDVIADIKSGKLTEAFGTGTAAVVSPVGRFCYKGETVTVGGGGIGKVTQSLYDELTGIQFGRIPDKNNWIIRL